MARSRRQALPLVVERTGRRRRLVQVFRWKPKSYVQVWLLAVFGSGVPVFIVLSAMYSGAGARELGWGWPVALVQAMALTFVIGLGQSWQLNRRRQQGR